MNYGAWTVVVPSNRPERLEGFKEAWGELFEKHNVRLIVVEDAPPWEGIPDFIPRRTDMIRSWGFYQAWKLGCRYILSLDDDVLPQSSDFFQAYEREFDRGAPYSPYYSVGSQTSTGLEMRGFPYEGRKAEVGFQYGGWEGCADLDAITQLSTRPQHCWFKETVVPVPKGTGVTCCAMNFCFRSYLAPIAWQLPLYGGRYNRFGDIWSGLVQKRVLDAIGKVMLINGQATVEHKRASDPYVNLEREQPGIRPNEDLWEKLRISLLGTSSMEMMSAFKLVTSQLYYHFGSFDPEYAQHFRYCRDAWMELFS